MLNSRYETPYTLMVTPVLKRRSRAPPLVPGFCILFHSRAVQVGRAMLLFSDLEPRGHVGLAGRSAYAIPCEYIAPLGRVSWIVPIILSVPDNPNHREICSPCTLYTNPHYPQKYRNLATGASLSATCALGVGSRRNDTSTARGRGPIHFHLQSDCWQLLPPELLRTSGDCSKFNVYGVLRPRLPVSPILSIHLGGVHGAKNNLSSKRV